MEHSYTFDAVAGTPYVASLVTTSGDPDITVFEDTSQIIFVGSSDDFTPFTALDDVSFIANATQTHAIAIEGNDPANCYTLEVKSNVLTVDGGAQSDSTYNDDFYYSFDGTNGTPYTVSVTPTTGEVSLTVVDENLVGVGSSNLPGADSVSILDTAPTQTYYIRVLPVFSLSSVDNNFSVSVTSAAPALPAPPAPAP